MNMFAIKRPAYLIDSENVGSTWVDLLKNSEKCDFYIFVTENAKSLNFLLLKELTDNQKHKISIIECESGRNSLDFYLSSYLGYLIGMGKHSSYIVVSQDAGFDHVIDYWKRNGIDVSKLNTKPSKAKESKAKAPKQNKHPKKNANSETRVIVKKQPQEQAREEKKPEKKKDVGAAKESCNRLMLKKLLKGCSEDEVEEVGKLLDGIALDRRSDKGYIYRHLVRKFKSEKGLEIYTLIKKDLDKCYRN